MKPLLQIHRRNLTLFALGTLCSVSAILTPARAEDPYVLWATTGPKADGVGSTVFDPKGELHVIPSFAPSFSSGLAILRFDREGRLASTNRLEGLRSYVGRLTIDGHGNSYLTGMIKTNGFFDTSQVHGFFTAKFSPENELLWVRSQGLGDLPNVETYGSAITVDEEGSVIVGGVSQGPMTLGLFTLGEGGGPFVCKYDHDGQVLWVKRIEHQNVGIHNTEYLYDLSVDPTGHIIISGFLSEGTADFGGTTVFPGSTGYGYGGDAYLARFNSDGDLDWVQLGYGTSAVTDKQGSIYVNWGRPVQGTTGIAKLNTNGTVLWSKTFPGAYLESPGAITLDPNGEPVFTGQFEGTASFDSISVRERGSGFGDVFVAKADAQGNVQWAMSGGSLTFDRGEQVACDAQGNIFLTGVITGTGSLGGLPLVPSAVGNVTLFAAKLNPTPPLNIKSSIAGVTISWPVRATNYVLEAATSLPADSWNTVTNTPIVSSAERSVQLPLTNEAKFFRLRK